MRALGKCSLNYVSVTQMAYIRLNNTLLTEFVVVLSEGANWLESYTKKPQQAK